MLTGSELAEVVETLGESIVQTSSIGDVLGLSSRSRVTWQISFIALITSLVRGRPDIVLAE